MGKGMPLITASHSSLASPSAQTYQEVDAAMPFGRGYPKFWVSDHHLRRFGVGAQQLVG